MSTSQFEYSGTELDALAEARNYYQSILAYFAPYIGDRVIEVGAGIGTIAELVLQAVHPSEMVLVEPAANNFAVLHKRFADDARVRTLNSYLHELVGTISGDSFIAINVLEHVEDDAGFLRGAHDVLAAGGRLLLFVPALQAIYGTLDEEFEHFRRYDKPALRTRIESAGFRLTRLQYVNFPGIFAWWLSGRVLRRRTLSARDVRLYDRLVVPWLSQLERRWAPPLGQSLLAIGVREP